MKAPRYNVISYKQLSSDLPHLPHAQKRLSILHNVTVIGHFKYDNNNNNVYL